MTHFYFTERKDCKNKLDRTLRVYTIKNGVLEYVTEREHRPGNGSRGAFSETFQALLEIGAIPEKYRGNGYYFFNETGLLDEYDITEIY